MTSQLTARLLVASGLTLVGVALLAYTAWARHGGSPAARRWMGNEFGSFTRDERMTVLGAPMLGVLCLCAAAIVLPEVGRYLAWLAVPLGLGAFVTLLWAMMTFLPLPGAFYPRWARPLRDRNRRTEQSIHAGLRRR
ncbi:hypothetical protein NLU66_17090 [Brachybacterium sp. NBEC-018]|uniref:hypothetical protein n=1 Tax=Brachybacterium sp. NBEC-018 TaxID=2996004 RepID=UPI002175585A|nr:hypothetical protein [Brachybacterium sp. NBEC-018]UVY83902.1 hypothetical protein NLU66_17090 [Brachybacterium sp. NBEC-018]